MVFVHTEFLDAVEAALITVGSHRLHDVLDRHEADDFPVQHRGDDIRVLFLKADFGHRLDELSAVRTEDIRTSVHVDVADLPADAVDFVKLLPQGAADD